MIFTPYKDESEIINTIHRFNHNDYALIRITQTMINKNNTDANVFFRDILKKARIVDYDCMSNCEKVSTTAKYILNDSVQDITVNFNVVKTRADKRFSISKIAERNRNGEINVGDLLYFSYSKNGDQTYLIIANLTHNTPSESALSSIFGTDDMLKVKDELLGKMRKIISEGYHKNSKGSGELNPKDAGDTLEQLLGVQTNNRKEADYKGIELKTKVSKAKTKDTLFTLRPRFEGTAIEKYEPNDKNRVSAFARYYGYESDAHPNCQSLYITIGSKDAPQNNQGFYLEVNENKRQVELWHINDNGRDEIAAFWNFDDLKEELSIKHPATLWVKAESRINGDIIEFKYSDLEFSSSPQFMTFISLIKSGTVTYDWRGYTSKEGKYQGKNHGNAWRIKPKLKSLLFGEIESINL